MPIHKVKIRIIIDIESVIEISSTNKFKKPAKLPSEIPNPPGSNETAPSTIEDR